MALEALTALSLASSVIQFVDFGSKLLSKGREIYNSADGSSVGNAELELKATDLQHLTTRLNQSAVQRHGSASSKPSDVALLEICAQCSAVADELLLVLDKLKVPGAASRRWRSFRQALSSVLKKKRVDEIKLRLQSFRQQLDLHVLVSLREDLDLQTIKQSRSFLKLEQDTQALTNHLLLEKQEILDALSNQTNTFTNQQDHTNGIIVAQHNQTRQELLASIQSAALGKSSRQADIYDEGEDGDEHPEKIHLVQWLILESLRFQTMDDRYEEIEQAHKATFEWIFKTPDPEHQIWADFPQWLSSGSGVYWINGKAASGKSTIMRFIFDEPRTKNLLSEWSKRHQLVHIAHFFWNSGTPDQRSYIGLLRALLFKVLSQCQYLMPEVFPELWKDKMSQPFFILKDMTHTRHIPWTLGKLATAFDRLVLAQNRSIHFCLFVDGLDEYDGDYSDVVKIFTRISQFPNVKVCLSSRPLVDFVVSFKQCPSLRLQDLTFGDIKQYINDELESNPHMQILLADTPGEAKLLVLEIIKRANGVFLWVKDLAMRLDLLPPSLEDLFSHILGRLQPVYMEQSSRIFQIFAESQMPMSRYITPSETVTSPGKLTTLELSFAEDQDWSKSLYDDDQKISDGELSRRCRLAEDWLRTRCGGLIEAHRPVDTGDDCLRCPSNARLSYLHRTVRDFLELPQIWEQILKPMAGKGFFPSAALMKSLVIYIRNVLPHPNYTKGYLQILDVQNYARRCVAFAKRAEDLTGEAETVVLDELDRLCTQTLRGSVGNMYSWTTYTFESERPNVRDKHCDTFIALAVTTGLHHYVAKRFQREPWILRNKPGRPLLQYALSLRTSLCMENSEPNPDLVKLLLDYGGQVNTIYEDKPLWEHLLDRLHHTIRQPCLPPSDLVSKWLAIAKLFLEHGADPAQYVENDESKLAYVLVNGISSPYRELSQEAGVVLAMLVSPHCFAEQQRQVKTLALESQVPAPVSPTSESPIKNFKADDEPNHTTLTPCKVPVKEKTNKIESPETKVQTILSSSPRPIEPRKLPTNNHTRISSDQRTSSAEHWHSLSPTSSQETSWAQPTEQYYELPTECMAVKVFELDATEAPLIETQLPFGADTFRWPSIKIGDQVNKPPPIPPKIPLASVSDIHFSSKPNSTVQPIVVKIESIRSHQQYQNAHSSPLSPKAGAPQLRSFTAVAYSRSDAEAANSSHSRNLSDNSFPRPPNSSNYEQITRPYTPYPEHDIIIDRPPPHHFSTQPNPYPHSTMPSYPRDFYRPNPYQRPTLNTSISSNATFSTYIPYRSPSEASPSSQGLHSPQSSQHSYNSPSSQDLYSPQSSQHNYSSPSTLYSPRQHHPQQFSRHETLSPTHLSPVSYNPDNSPQYGKGQEFFHEEQQIDDKRKEAPKRRSLLGKMIGGFGRSKG